MQEDHEPKSADSATPAAGTPHRKTEMKFVLVGDQSVGKTCFAEAVLFETAADRYIPSVMDQYESTCLVEIGGPGTPGIRLKKIQVTFYDTSGEGDMLSPDRSFCS
jgi:GTPase SAR1 family protein